MSHEGLVQSSDLKSIFTSMAYEDRGPGNLASIKKWLLERPGGGVLSSQVNGNLVGNASDGIIIGLDSLSQAIGVDVKARLLSKDVDVVNAYTNRYKSGDATDVLNNAAKQDRVLKFQQLIKKHANDLVTLEGYAGSVPAWIINKQDEPTWLKSSSNAVSTELRNQLEDGNSQIQLHLSTNTYGLKHVIELLAAVVQVEGPIPIFITLNDVSSVHLLLPVVYLVDCVNNAGIRNQPIDILLIAPKLWSVGLLAKFAETDKSLGIPMTKTSKGVLVIGDSAILSAKITAGALNLSPGQTVHHVIEDSADIPSAISSISRNTWFCGVEMNHRCRSLVFTHESVYMQVIEELRKNVESIKVNSWDGNALLTICDFVTRKGNTSSTALSSIGKLGAKLLATKGDYTVPTVVYDIGTSSDLIAMKEADLGHVLVLIPYRSCNELFSLGNNFGVPDQLFLHSNCFNTSMSIIRRLNASQTLINTAPVQRSPLINSSWKVVSKLTTPMIVSKETTKNASLKSGASSSKWRELPASSRIQKLNQLIIANDVDPIILTDDSVAGIILVDAEGISAADFITLLISCVLREKPVVVVSLEKDLPVQITQSVQDNLPLGLVSFIIAKTTSDVTSLINDWELVWVLQGAGKTMDTEFIPRTSENRILLVNPPNIKPDGFNVKTAIESAYKKLYM